MAAQRDAHSQNFFVFSVPFSRKRLELGAPNRACTQAVKNAARRRCRLNNRERRFRHGRFFGGVIFIGSNCRLNRGRFRHPRFFGVVFGSNLLRHGRLGIFSRKGAPSWSVVVLVLSVTDNEFFFGVMFGNRVHG